MVLQLGDFGGVWFGDERDDEALDTLLADGKAESHNVLTSATYYKDTIIPAMEALRAVVDQMEVHVSSKYWPYPTYGDLMFKV